MEINNIFLWCGSCFSNFKLVFPLIRNIIASKAVAVTGIP